MSIYGPGKRSSTRSSAGNPRYVQKTYVDATKVAKTGGVMFGALDMNGYAIKNLPEVPQTGTDACSGAYAQAIGRECVTRDGGQGMRADLDMAGHHISKLGNPYHNRDAANKRYVDATVRSVKPCVTIWAERSGPFDGPYQFSFGAGSNGRDHRYCGYTMMSPGRVLRMGLSATTNLGLAAGETSVILVVNGEQKGDYHVTKSGQEFSSVEPFNVPLELAAGDRINFMSGQEDQTDPQATAIVVTLLVELDL